jgi:AraC-like DNA-binding protein
MLYRAYIPPPPLSHFVELFWYYEGSTVTHEQERILPDGMTELVIDLGDDNLRVYDAENPQRVQRFPGAVICGPHSQPFVIDTANQVAIIGVHFKAGGAFPFFRFPASELHDTHISLEDAWGLSAYDLRGQLLEAQTVESRFAILEVFLMAHVAHSLTRHPAVDYALQALRCDPTTQTIRDVTVKIGFSHKRFIQLFSKEVGLTPKLFSRVVRFQHVLRQIGRGQSVDWADMALAHGYFDQAHFIHDFQSFSGLTPAIYLAQKTEHLNHVPLSD